MRQFELDQKKERKERLYSISKECLASLVTSYPAQPDEAVSIAIRFAETLIARLEEIK